MNTYNPILKNTEYKGGIFVNTPTADDGKTIFLSHKGSTGDYLMITKGNNVSAKEIRKRNFNWITEIDTSNHAIEFNMPALSSNHIYSFNVTFRFNAKVTKPELIFQYSISDMSDYVRECIEGMIEDYSRNLEIHQIQELKRQIKDDFYPAIDLEEGIRLEFKAVTVDMDEEVRNQLKEVEDLKVKEMLRIQEAESANRIRDNYADDTGFLVEILKGNKSPEQLAQIRRELSKNKAGDQVEGIRLYTQMFKDLANDGAISEADLQNMTKAMLSRDFPAHRIDTQEKDAAKNYVDTEFTDEDFSSFD